MKAITSSTTNKINKKNAFKNKTNNFIKDNTNIIDKFLNEKKILNKELLQYIAFFFMVIDHIGTMWFPDANILKELGQIAFPIFCFLLTEGYIHTHNKSKYYLRLLGTAFVSEIPYDIATTGKVLNYQEQNVIFELLFGFIAINITDLIIKKFNDKKDKCLPNVLIWTSTLGIGILAEVFKCNYGLYGILLIMMFYYFKKYEEKDRFCIYLIFMTLLTTLFYPFQMQIFCVLSLIPIYFYNSETVKRIGNTGYKYLHYLFYPVHFAVLYGFKEVLNLI